MNCWYDFIYKFIIVYFIFADGEWSDEASRVIVELTQCRTLQAQIAGYTENGIPEILLYSFLGPNVSNDFIFPLNSFLVSPILLMHQFYLLSFQHIVYINQELVARNFAVWSNVTES